MIFGSILHVVVAKIKPATTIKIIPMIKTTFIVLIFLRGFTTGLGTACCGILCGCICTCGCATLCGATPGLAGCGCTVACGCATLCGSTPCPAAGCCTVGCCTSVCCVFLPSSSFILRFNALFCEAYTIVIGINANGLKTHSTAITIIDPIFSISSHD